MPPDPFLEAAASYALGSPEEADRLAFAAHLGAGCSTCAAAVADLHPVLDFRARGASASSPAPVVEGLLLDLAEAPRLPLDLSAYAGVVSCGGHEGVG